VGARNRELHALVLPIGRLKTMRLEAYFVARSTNQRRRRCIPQR